ncbi:disulfide bond formation protein B [Candidatus Nomurabacteria bacterium]|nr:disulfide bond formation protein B [Candidatus Nomurabacteria bacterium]
MNYEAIHYLNIVLGTGAIILQIFSVLALLMLCFGGKKNIFLDFLDKNFLAIGFAVAFVGTFFSLIYSEVVNFLPCYLCWYQRIFLFPLVFLFAVAMWQKDRKVIKYALPLVAIGFIVSVYQNFYYYFGQGSSLPCDASGVSCYQVLISEFGGYISLPMLALTTFFSLTALLLVTHFYKKVE